MVPVLVIAAAMLITQPALAVTVSGGYDFFLTNMQLSEVTIPGIGSIPLQGFAVPGPPDPMALFPLPEGAKPPTTKQVVGFQVTWHDPHGTVVGPESHHAVTQVVEPVWGDVISPFDTVVRRKADADISGVGGEATIPIEIAWLSLKSANPIDIGLPSLVDVYVGLNPGGQIEGKTQLVSTTSLGDAGTIGIGIPGLTPIDPANQDFLGLPVTYDVVFIPHGMDPIVDNVVYRIDDITTIFQNPSLGNYINIIPEPATLLLLTLGGLFLRKRKV